MLASSTSTVIGRPLPSTVEHQPHIFSRNPQSRFSPAPQQWQEPQRDAMRAAALHLSSSRPRFYHTVSGTGCVKGRLSKGFFPEEHCTDNTELRRHYQALGQSAGISRVYRPLHAIHACILHAVHVCMRAEPSKDEVLGVWSRGSTRLHVVYSRVCMHDTVRYRACIPRACIILAPDFSGDPAALCIRALLGQWDPPSGCRHTCIEPPRIPDLCFLFLSALTASMPRHWLMPASMPFPMYSNRLRKGAPRFLSSLCCRDVRF